MPWGRFFKAIAAAALIALSGAGAVRADSFGTTILSIEELDALDALRRGSATPQQRALLFMRNDAINRAALRGYVPDDVYQLAQREFAETNQRFAREAALEAGAEFRVQTASSATYSPGTDSDFITKVDSPEQIARMQEGYNRRINSYLAENRLNVQRGDWHVQLDTDFMADPSRVSEEQFRQIAKMNNDAYKRRAAAVYEAVSRAGDGTLVTPEQFTAYAEEMKDFAAKKQKLLAQMRADPRLMTSPSFQADFQRVMAQEQKYISRIEASNALLRQQRGLPPIQSLDDAAMWSLKQADDGTWRLVRDPSLAQLGSKRAAGAFRTTAVASALAQNSIENALEQLAQSTAEAAMRDPDFAQRAAKDIATLLADLPPNRKGAFLAQIAESQGQSFAREVTEAMRSQHRAAMQAGASGIRSWAAGMLRALEVAGVAYEVYQAGSALKEYVEALQAALDPNLTDEEAAEFFAKAQAAGAQMALSGGLGALFEAYPPLAAAMGSFVISFYGTRILLENTETGQMIDLAVTDFFDRHIQAAERAICEAKEFFGYRSECEALREVQQQLLERVLAAVREGRWRLADGKTMLDVIEAIRAGDLSGVGDLLVESDAWKAARAEAEALEARLAELVAQCGSGPVPASTGATGDAAGTAPAVEDPFPAAARICLDAMFADSALAGSAGSVRELASRALAGFAAAETAIGRCEGGTELDRAFAMAQTASSDAASAARAFAGVVQDAEAADALIASARATAESAIAAIGRTEEACTDEINSLIDAAAVAQSGVEWPRMKARFAAVQDAAVGVAEVRGEGRAAAQRAELADCAALAEGPDRQLRAMEAILSLDGIPDRRAKIEAAAQACRDEIDAAAPPQPPVVAAAGPMSTPGSPGADDPGGISDPAALQNCLCACNQGRTEFSCGYDMADRGWSPSCANLANGPCICKAFGCFRAQPVTSGECYAKCTARFGG